MAKKKQSRAGRKQFFILARLLHIYISTALFALMLFFCVTGYFLNHPEAFSGEGKDSSVSFTLDKEWEKNASIETQVETLAVMLSDDYTLPLPESFDYDEELGELLLDYSLPAGYASAVLTLETGEVVLDYRRGNALAVINDLHKGRHSGELWSWVIDLSAWLMVFFSLTGLVLVFQNKRQRKTAFLLTLLGTLTPIVFYWLWVPGISGVVS